MKKRLISALGMIAILILMMSFLAVSGCAKNDSSYKNGPDAAYYSDWDRAVRYDVDMQNMLGNPGKLPME